MPHRPNPIPRYNGSNLPSQSQLHPNTTDVVTGSRREKDGLPPRHRASSGASEPSSNTHASAPASGSSNSAAGTTPGGRPSGRALPPPRFQRKQRPPRVQQAIAAAANASSSSNATSGATPNSTQSGGGRRGAANKEGGSSGQRGGAGTGTLTLGPANNWGAGTSAVVSLSMATINAASARASVVHPPQPHPPPPTIPTFDDTQRMDRSLPADFLSGMGRAELEGLDPVQLHNRITFGMGRTSTALRNDLYASEYIHHPNNYSVLPPNLSGLEQDGYLLSSGGLSGGTRDHTATVRTRSHSHNHAAHTPTSSFYHPTNATQVQGGTRAYSPIHPSSPYASNFGPETPPTTHAIAPPHLHSGVDYDHQLRIRSQSLMAPMESYRQSQSREPLAFPLSLSSHPVLPLSQHYRQPSLTGTPSKLTSTPARYDSTSSMQAQHHLSLNTDLGSDIRLSGSAPQSASGSGPNVNRKPLKSALKVRKSAPDLADPGRGSPPPMPGHPGSDGGHGHHAQGHLVERSREPAILPDPGFKLPDESLQAQYAHQLRLLQEEYATKAAKAEKSRRRSLERNKVTPGLTVVHGEERNHPSGMGREVDYDIQEVMVPARGRPNLDSTPPSSGGGSAGGHRVAFFEEVKVIDPEKGMGTRDADQDAEGYLSWDDEWTGEGDDDDVTEFVYEPSVGVDVRTGGIVERSAIDSELSPGTEASDFDDDGGSDIGDRGHDDATRFTRRRRDTGESPPSRQAFQEDVSPVESIISPVQAIVHGHEPSPVSTQPTDRYDAQLQANLVIVPFSADTPSLLPLVEIIAPTPIRMLKELEPSEEMPRVELPKFDEMDKDDGIVGGVMPMSSTDSTESSDSNRTLKIGQAGSATSGSDTTVAPTTRVSPVEEAPSAANRRSPHRDEVPASGIPQMSFPPQEQQGATPLPHLPATLQRLARRISRGTPPISQPKPSYSAVPPLIPGPPPITDPSSEHHHTFHDVAAFDYPLDDDESLRRLSSITSLSSASSGLHGTIFPRPPASFVPNLASAIERDLTYPQTATYGPTEPVSYQNQNHVHNRMPARPILPPPVPPQAVRRPPPDSAISHSLSRRISRQSALGDYSSAASVESGSSHGGGTSGASHVNRSRGRSVAGSMLSTSSSSGSHRRNLRAPPGPSYGQSNSISPAQSSPGIDSLLSHTSSEQWDRGLLSNARSSESLGAVSAASGKSGGSGGSNGKSAGRALGGESIWTMGKEEEARWPPVPSSSGHGHSTQSKAQTQYTLRSLVPQVEAIMLSEPASSIPSSEYRTSSLHSGSQLSHELALPSDTFDSFYPSYNPYSLPPAPETDRPRLSIQHSHSAPALPVYEGDRGQVSTKDPGRRRESRQSTLRNDWDDNRRYHDQDSSQFQDGLFSQAVPQVQLRAQAPPFAPASARYHLEQRLPPQSSSRSLPIMNHPDSRGTFESRRNFEEDGRMDSTSHPVSASSSRPSTARSALYVGPGAGDADHYSARKSMMALPATGGVFPRYQEMTSPYAETTVGRPGSSSGRFKGLFKSRDSRVFK